MGIERIALLSQDAEILRGEDLQDFKAEYPVAIVVGDRGSLEYQPRWHYFKTFQDVPAIPGGTVIQAIEKQCQLKQVAAPQILPVILPPAKEQTYGHLAIAALLLLEAEDRKLFQSQVDELSANAKPLPAFKGLIEPEYRKDVVGFIQEGLFEPGERAILLPLKPSVSEPTWGECLMIVRKAYPTQIVLEYPDESRCTTELYDQIALPEPQYCSERQLKISRQYWLAQQLYKLLESIRD